MLRRLREHPHKQLFLILHVALCARLLLWSVYVNKHEGLHAAEYDIIAKHLLNGKGYSYIEPDSDGIRYTFRPMSDAAPSAYMMPGYTLFIAAMHLMPTAAAESFALCFSQSLFALATIALLWFWLRDTFGKRIAVWACWTAALLPEFILASSLGASVVLVQFFSVVLCSVGWWYRPTATRRLLLALAAALLLSIRAEALLFLGVLAVVYVVRRNYDRAATIVVGAALLLTPWTIRNATVFGSFIPLTTSGGVNLYRGHNPYGVGVWADDRIANSIRSMHYDERVELRIDSLYKAEVAHYLSTMPTVELERSAWKLLQLFSMEPNDSRAGNPAYWFPSIVIGVMFVGGFLLSLRLRLRQAPEATIYIACSTIATMVFFCLPRYQSMLRIILLPYAMIGVEWVLGKVRGKNEVKGEM